LERFAKLYENYLRNGTRRPKAAQEDQAGLGAILKKTRDVSAHRHKEHQKRAWKGSRNSTRTICATAQEDQKQHKKTKADLGAILKKARDVSTQRHKEHQKRTWRGSRNSMRTICALAQRRPRRTRVQSSGSLGTYLRNGTRRPERTQKSMPEL
jgi:hypothetical protein